MRIRYQRPFTLPSDWPFHDDVRAPRPFIWQDSGGDDDPIKKAQFERDSALAQVATLKKQIEDLQGKVPTDEERKRLKDLETQAAQAEEDRKKKAGEWDALKTQLVTQHQAEIARRDEEIKRLGSYINDREVELAFSNAVDGKVPWFGGADAKTVLTPGLAADAFRKYVEVQDVDAGNGVKAKRVVVKKPDGTSIIGPDGNPKPFHEAIGELIQSLPYKDNILRGSGKTGSGSSGGTTNPGGDTVDLSNPTAEQLRDPKIREQVRRRQEQAGGISIGSFFDQQQTAQK